MNHRLSYNHWTATPKEARNQYSTRLPAFCNNYLAVQMKNRAFSRVGAGQGNGVEGRNSPGIYEILSSEACQGCLEAFLLITDPASDNLAASAAIRSAITSLPHSLRWHQSMNTGCDTSAKVPLRS